MTRAATALRRLWSVVRALLQRERLDADIDEELAFHVEREAALLTERGLAFTDARREALRRFGGVQRYREECREVRQVSWLDDLATDARFALRLVRFHPGFSANVIIIAALGVAACSTTFSLVSGILLSPLPFSTPDRVATLELRSGEGSSTAAFPAEAYLRIAAGSPVIDVIAAYQPSSVAALWNGEPERISGERVTPSFFRVYGITPVVGRAFTDDEAESRAPVVLLGNELWRTRFNADPSVVGRRIVLEDAPYTVIGVMPPRFRAQFTDDRGVWQPMTVAPRDTAGRASSVNAVVRLADTVTRARAEAWLSTVVHGRMPSSTYNDSVSASPALVPIAELVYGDVERQLRVLLGAVLLVLVLVAANVATMFLVRTAAREQELDVRRALGASAGRQLRQLVTEAVALTAIGGAAGAAASYWSIGAIRGLGIRVLPRMDDVALDWRVLFFAVAATMLTGIVGGLAPALAAGRGSSLAGRTAASARVTNQRTSSTFVVAQIALSVVLLVGAGLLMKGFLRVLPTDPGFAVDNRAVLMVRLRDQPSFPDTNAEASRRFLYEVADRMRGVRGVREVAAMSFAPFFGSVSIADIELPGRAPSEKPFSAYQNFVTANFFDVMRMPLRRGRAFSAADNDGSRRVAVINETAAARWWPGENPIGKLLTLRQRGERSVITVVGVSGDGRLAGRDTKIRPEIYLPVAQTNPRFITFVAHTSVAPRSISRELQRAIWAVAPRLPIGTTSDLWTVASDSVRRTRFFSVAMTMFAVVAIGLTGLGIYGLLAFAVAQRRREIGIRIALGAPARSVAASVVRRALVLGVGGVAIGVLLARWLSRYMEHLLVEVGATDAAVFAGTAVAVLAVALMSACAPALQAARVDPIKSLRV
jgi:putative ABC transport system permease protein